MDPAPRAPVDLTPLALRERHETLARTVRGYDPETVNHLFRRIADRLEGLERHNAALAERVNDLAKKVFFHEGRAWAVQEALVTAQALRAEAREQAKQDADRIRGQASREAEALLSASRQESAKIGERAKELERRTVAHRAAVVAETQRRRAVLDEETEGRLRAAQSAARAELDDARSALSRELEEADRYCRSVRQEAEAAAQQVRDRATRDAEEVLSRAEAWAEEERRRLSAEIERLEEEALQASRRTRDEAVRVSRDLRTRAKRDAARVREKAKGRLEDADAALAQAEADSKLIRHEVRREVEELRAHAAADADATRAQAVAQSAEILEHAEREATDLRESRLLELERASAKLQMQIEERHRILERLAARRSRFLGNVRSLLVHEIEFFDAERAGDGIAPADRSPAGPEDIDAVVIGSGLDEVETPRSTVGAPELGVAVGWATMINPDTGEVVSSRGLLPVPGSKARAASGGSEPESAAADAVAEGDQGGEEMELAEPGPSGSSETESVQ